LDEELDEELGEELDEELNIGEDEEVEVTGSLTLLPLFCPFPEIKVWNPWLL